MCALSVKFAFCLLVGMLLTVNTKYILLGNNLLIPTRPMYHVLFGMQLLHNTQIVLLLLQDLLSLLHQELALWLLSWSCEMLMAVCK